MFYTSVGPKYQTTIPKTVREFLNLHQGDRIGFDISNNQIIIKKILPLDFEFAKATEATLGEWLNQADDEDYANI